MIVAAMRQNEITKIFIKKKNKQTKRKNKKESRRIRNCKFKMAVFFIYNIHEAI